MSANSVTGAGQGSVQGTSTSELNTSINILENFRARFPSGTYSTIEVTLGEEDPTIGSVEIQLKDCFDNDHLFPCQLVSFFSSSATSIAFDGEFFYDTVEMINGVEDLVCLISTVGSSAKNIVVPNHTDDYVLNVEFRNIAESTSSGLYFGVIFPDGTFKISDVEIVLEPSEP